ncbi:unnamed protein product, partial [Ectocarpus fasciculatus]
DCAYGYLFGYDTGCDIDCSGDGSRAISGSDTPTDSTSTTDDTTTPGVITGSDTSYSEHSSFSTYTTPGSFSDTITSTTSTWCTTEYLACAGDSACAVCYESFGESWDTCASSVVSASSSNGCDVLEDIACCAVDGCEGNELMVAYFDCLFAADSGCAVEVGACAGDGSRAISGSDTPTDSTTGVISGSDTYSGHSSFTTYTTPGFFSDSYTTTSTTSTSCPDEYWACVEDSACAECYQSFWDSWLTCDNSAITVASSNGCDTLEGMACCAVNGCEGNELMVAYFDCAFAFADPECPVEVGACAGDGSRAISGSDSTSSVAFPTTTTTSAFSSDSVSMTNDTSICAAEDDACTADPSCLACVEAAVSSQEACQVDYDTATCDEKHEANCCAIAGGTDCENNALLGALYDCVMADDGCTGALTDCLDGSQSSSTGRGITAADDDGSGGDGDGGGGGGASTGGDPSPAPLGSPAPVGDTNMSENDDDSEGTGEVDPVPVEGDDEEEGNSAGDADAADTDASSAARSATAVGGSTAATGVVVALLLVAAGAPGLWRRFQ